VDAIPILDQNSDEAILLLRAQRKMYSSAKRVRNVRLLGSVLPAIIAPIAMIQWPDIKPFLAGVSGVWVFASLLVFKRIEKQWTEIAAKIQEQFDTQVLGLLWNEHLVGSRVPPEDIHSAAKGVDPKKEHLFDWYSSVGTDDRILHILIAQRSNLAWDRRLRRGYAWLVVSCTVGLFLVYLLGGIYYKMDLQQYVTALLLPSCAALVHGIEMAINHFEASATREGDRKAVDQLLVQHHRTPSAVTLEECRKIQDRIYASRKEGVTVPDWWYWYRRPAEQEAMTYGAQKSSTKP
jgi:hypothetical protein